VHSSILPIHSIPNFSANPLNDRRAFFVSSQEKNYLILRINVDRTNPAKPLNFVTCRIGPASSLFESHFNGFAMESSMKGKKDQYN
jgi:hypothetical protein